ncbi:bifunctional precorrin-2 dehydrogenase/sirohydrochlorin ferrochelatase [Halobacteriaceae archaeon GCM10025711]
MIPLLHDFTGATVLVFGGGRVGARKARRFGHEARVVVVSPSFADADFGDAERVRARPDPDDVDVWIARADPALVVAATDDETVNGAVAAAARDHGSLVNRADESGGRDAGGVVVPATVRDDPVVVAVGTGATSPALSRYLRKELEPLLDGAGAVADLTADVRRDLHEWGVPPEARRAVVRRVVESPAVWKATRTGGDAASVVEELVADALEEEGRD